MTLLKSFEYKISYASQTDSSHQSGQIKTKVVAYFAHLSKYFNDNSKYPFLFIVKKKTDYSLKQDLILL